MNRLVASGILLLVLGAVGAGCGSSEPTGTTEGAVSEVDATPASPLPKGAQEATADRDEGKQSKNGKPLSGIALKATCTLKGKAQANVTLEYTDEGFDLTFEGQPVPLRGTALYSATVFDRTGEYGDQLGVKYLDGQQIAYFVYALDGSSGQTNLAGEAIVNGDTVSASFPADDLGQLAKAGPATWSAAFNVEGKDVGECPGGIHSLPFPAD